MAAAKPAPAEGVVQASADKVGEVAQQPAAPVVASHAAAKAATPFPAKKGPLSTVQRLVVKHVVKQLDKTKANSQNAANVEHTAASKVGSSALVILAGAVIILIGGLIGGANIVVTIGGIVFVVGLVLLILALVNGK